MPNGKPGDHPLTDILHYGSSEFGEPVDSLVKQLAASDRFFQVRDEVGDLLWEWSPFGRPAERDVLIAKTVDALKAIQKRLL